MLHESFKSVLQVFQKYLMTDSRFFQACFLEEWTDDIMDNKKILKFQIYAGLKTILWY